MKPLRALRRGDCIGVGTRLYPGCAPNTGFLAGDRLDPAPGAAVRRTPAARPCCRT